MIPFLFPHFLLLLLVGEVVDGIKLTPQNLDQQVGPVVFVNMLYRHGERNPIHPCPTDPYRDLKYWPEGYGQLTNIGKLHHYQLGMWLRKRYLHLIPNGKYHHDAIKVQSTDVDRTLMSAQANLAGMFPPQKEEKWSQINWQPIPIHTIPKHLDNVLSMGARCPKYDRLRRIFMQSEEFESILQRYLHVLEYCSQHAGKTCTLGAVNDINSDLLIEQQRNFSLPEWTAKIYPKYTEEVAALQFSLGTWTVGMKRLLGGPLVKKMTDNMLKKVNQTKTFVQTMAVFSAHDSTIVRLLNTLGVYNFVSPPFHSLVLVELRRGNDNEHYVTILFKNSTNPSGKPHLLKLPGCEEACNLKKMIDLLSPVIPNDWRRECADKEQIVSGTKDIDLLQGNDEVFDEEKRPLRLGYQHT